MFSSQVEQRMTRAPGGGNCGGTLGGGSRAGGLAVIQDAASPAIRQLLNIDALTASRNALGASRWGCTHKPSLGLKGRRSPAPGETRGLEHTPNLRRPEGPQEPLRHPFRVHEPGAGRPIPGVSPRAGLLRPFRPRAIGCHWVRNPSVQRSSLSGDRSPRNRGFGHHEQIRPRVASVEGAGGPP